MHKHARVEFDDVVVAEGIVHHHGVGHLDSGITHAIRAGACALRRGAVSSVTVQLDGQSPISISVSDHDPDWIVREVSRMILG